MRVLVATAALTLVACRAPWIREGSGARSPELEELARRYEPDVVRMLGTRWEQPFEIWQVDELDEGPGITDVRTRRVSIVRSDKMHEHLLHELGHVHALEPWSKMPRAVQEGVVWYVAILSLGYTDRYRGPEPTVGDLRAALSLTSEEYDALEDKLPVDQAATWLASKLFTDDVLPKKRTKVDQKAGGKQSGKAVLQPK